MSTSPGNASRRRISIEAERGEGKVVVEGGGREKGGDADVDRKRRVFISIGWPQGSISAHHEAAAIGHDCTR